MKITTTIPLEGHLKIYKKFVDGGEELFFDQKNVITTVEKQFILLGIYTSNIPSDPISSTAGLHVGTGGTVDPQGLFPKIENPAWTNLNSPLLTNIATTYTVNLAVPSVTFLADISEAQGNGSLISEAALFTEAGNMFNVKCHPAISKSNAFALHYLWTIKMA